MDATLSLLLIEAVLILLAIAISKAIGLISPLDDSCKDVDSIPTVSSPSRIISSPTATKYDVFLSFRGEDTRDAFSSYLYEALCNANIHTFMDHKLHKGQHIAPVLLKTIEESEISLIIFSKDYASSTWCMDELVHIMKCRDKYGRIVIPVFYNVDPSNIRKQDGSFGDGFAKLKFRFKHNLEKVQEWKNALIQSTKLSGWDSKNIRPESKLVKKIVEDILSKLNTESSFHVEGLVGIDHQIQKIEELLHEARIVGIWGMGGIGKTTLARAVFLKLNEKFEAFSFVGNVREQLKRIGLDELQKKCLEELLKDEDVKAYNLKSTSVKNRLHRKKILLILDDVDSSIAIEDLIKVSDWFGEGSRIIITSRDMQVLKNTSACRTYHVPQLDSHQALHLFSLKAFKQNEPSKSYLELSKWVVDYCEGNPLALIVLGCFLHGRGKEEWESAMKKLNQTLHKDIFNVLKLSFDGLDYTQKNVFLDLAFFLNEAWRISVEDCTRRIYDSFAHIEISVLKERSLISVHENGDIEMHALLMDMGLEISRQQLISNPEKPIRLWRHEDIYNFFHNDKGAEEVQCLSLDMSKIKRITLTTSNFQKMYNLKFLKLYKSERKKPSKVNIYGDLDSLPEELKFLFWIDCPLQSMPLSFCAENLVHLIMPNSRLQQLWDGNQQFPNLKKIDVSNSKYLMALPDLSDAPNLEKLEVDGCVNLAQIHSSNVLGKLTHLTLESCKRSRHIDFGGGSVNGTNKSGLVTINNFFDFNEFSFTKVTMKLLVSDDGNVITGFKFKLLFMPFEEILECRDYIESMKLILWTQSLSFLLPFVWTVHWSESPIEFGNFKQYFDCDHYYDSHVFGERIQIKMKEVGVEKKAQSSVVWPLIVRGDVVDEYYEEEECCSNNDKNYTLTRVPNYITRWSLLKQVSLKKSDIIGSGGLSIPQVWILRSLARSECCEGLQTLKDTRLCLDVPTRDWCGQDFCVSYVHSSECVRDMAMGALSLALFVFGTDIVF
ncbi:hypothetical protein QN277_005598 [Acacia crassicarpa]|uniref:TIR domain-containing protein n=1 Tax=Acacia crassicarpa TaxID=499986 RepID=A0AAE1JXC6_9FABA|nr:hypothetical protein QN277_005598 [Acacia crassicarpa]